MDRLVRSFIIYLVFHINFVMSYTHLMWHENDRGNSITEPIPIITNEAHLETAVRAKP
uniref:Uncharacterized protein n=1 Tax=Heterorhabditis bacteriophora TaxID=37862 RepID=A0A1I7WCP9_HETBA